MKKATKPHSKTVKDTRSAYHVRANRTGRAGKAVKKIDLAIPESVFESSRQLAQKLGMPLSEFYTAALAAYISAHQAASVPDQLNRVYATESSELDPALVQVQVALLGCRPQPHQSAWTLVTCCANDGHLSPVFRA